jgi:hypothetical protein
VQQVAGILMEEVMLSKGLLRLDVSPTILHSWKRVMFEGKISKNRHYNIFENHSLLSFSKYPFIAALFTGTFGRLI